MSSISSLKCATALLFLGLAGIPFLAQQRPDQQQPSQSPDQAATAPNQQQTQSFMGKIAKSKDGYVLRDEASSVTYKLDSEEQAKPFVGKNVKVTGTLDPATSTIHVVSIETGS